MQEGPVSKIPTSARGRGKGKGCASGVGSRTEPTEQLASNSSTLERVDISDSSDKEASGGDGTDGERGSPSLRKAVVDALRMVAVKRSQPARNGVLMHAEFAIMATASLQSVAERQTAALNKELA